MKASRATSAPSLHFKRAIARRRLGVYDAELAPVVGREERCHARDRADRGTLAVACAAPLVGNRPRPRSRVARVEAAVEQIGRALVDEPRRRTVDEDRPARREALAVAALERRDEAVAVADGAQAQAAHVDVERGQLDRMAVRCRADRRSACADGAPSETARAPSARCETRVPKASWTASSRISSRSASSQSSAGVDSIIAEDRLGVADHAAQPRRVEVERARRASCRPAPRSRARRCGRGPAAPRRRPPAARKGRARGRPDRGNAALRRLAAPPQASPRRARRRRSSRTCRRCAGLAGRFRWPTRPCRYSPLGCGPAPRSYCSRPTAA